MESFAAHFPRVNLDTGFQGWFVSSLLLLAWAGSLVNGPVADRFGRKGSMLLAVVIFTVGSALQAGGMNIETIFAGETPLSARMTIEHDFLMFLFTTLPKKKE